MSNSFSTLPRDAAQILDWDWPRFEPYYQELASRRLSKESVVQFLSDWTRLRDLLDEMFARLNVAKDSNTADKQAEARYNRYLDEIYPKMMPEEQRLKKKLLESGLRPEGFELPLRRIETEASLFREANLPLIVEVNKLCTEYSKIVGAQTVQWEGKELTIAQLRPILEEPDRDKREKAWRLATERQLADRSAINDLWQKLLNLRLKIAANAGLPDYRSYRWLDLARFDYTPKDCFEFHCSIEKVVVPLAAELLERRRKRLGVDRLRPWDTAVDPLGRPRLRPFEDVNELIAGTRTILQQVDDRIGRAFTVLVEERLLDLDNRKNKAPGGYCTSFPAVKRPFIFMNAVGTHQDLMTLIHESGHAVHDIEASRLPYFQQRQINLEFAEVASMGMELLSMPFWTRDQGGFYTEAEAQRAQQEHLEGLVLFWPYMSVVDLFQHWVYENPDQARDPARCDAEWARLWQRFMPVVDWSGFEDALATGWHRKLHIHLEPFYYVEYGLAQLGACQVWLNAQRDRTSAVTAFLEALGLGGTRPLPELYGTAGARFAFDAETLAAVIGPIRRL
ncbi:MAG: M3 family oligoendopeptidase [candidate division WOR-3 bacterium]